MLEELYSGIESSTGTATNAESLINDFLNGTGVVSRKMMANNSVDTTKIADGSVNNSKITDGSVSTSKLADVSVTNGKLADDSIGASKLRDGSVGKGKLGIHSVIDTNIADDAIGRRHLLIGAVANRHIGDGEVDSIKISEDAASLNSGKEKPLVNYKVDGTAKPIEQRVKNVFYDAQVQNAEKGKVYRVEGIRHGLSGTYGLHVASFDDSTDNNLDTSTRKREINHVSSVYPTKILYSEDGKTGTIIAENPENGLIVSTVFDAETIGRVLNLSENDIGQAQGAIIDPSNYIYKAEGNVVEPLRKQVHCIKTEKEVLVIVPTVKDYLGFSIKRKTVPYQEGVNGSNLDLWSLDRISGYEIKDSQYVEKPGLVYVYTPDSFDTPMTTQDTMVKRVGDSDYSGGNQHGDEKVQSFDIFVGNGLMTDATFDRSGEQVMLVQETLLYPDSKTNGPDTQPFAKVNKTHVFDVDNVYTLHQRLEFLTDTDVNFACQGSLQMRRTHGNGSGNNIQYVVALDNSKVFDVRNVDTEDKHMSEQNEHRYKITGFYKEIELTFKTDSDYNNFYFRNWAVNDVKFYALVLPENTLAEQGKVIRSSLNYKFKSLN